MATYYITKKGFGTWFSDFSSYGLPSMFFEYHQDNKKRVKLTKESIQAATEWFDPMELETAIASCVSCPAWFGKGEDSLPKWVYADFDRYQRLILSKLKKVVKVKGKRVGKADTATYYVTREGFGKWLKKTTKMPNPIWNNWFRSFEDREGRILIDEKATEALGLTISLEALERALAVSLKDCPKWFGKGDKHTPKWVVQSYARYRKLLTRKLQELIRQKGKEA